MTGRRFVPQVPPSQLQCLCVSSSPSVSRLDAYYPLSSKWPRGARTWLRSSSRDSPARIFTLEAAIHQCHWSRFTRGLLSEHLLIISIVRSEAQLSGSPPPLGSSADSNLIRVQTAFSPPARPVRLWMAFVPFLPNI